MSSRIDILSRRRFLRSAAGLAGAATVAGLVAGNASAATLPSQKDVEYRNSPNGDQNCANCGLFRQPNLCSGVAGNVIAQGWCNIWRKKDV